MTGQIGTTAFTKRGVLRGAVTLPALPLLAACGGPAGDQSGVGGAPKSAGPVKITYWGTQPGSPTAEPAVAEAFNKTQQDVVVTYEFQGAYADLANKLTAALQARTAPDVPLLSDVWWFKFFAQKMLLPLDDLMKSEKIDSKDFVEALYNEGVRDGKSYWLPFARSTPIFYYNKEAWQKAGLPDRGPRNWDEFSKEWAPKLKSGGGVQNAYGHGDNGSYIAWLFQCVIWQFGGAYSDAQFNIKIAEPNGVRAGEFYRSSVKDGWAYVPQSQANDFRSGLTAAIMGSTATLAAHENAAKFPVGTAFLPEGPAGFGCCTGGAGMSILTTTPADRRAAAMKWINYATGAGNPAFVQGTGYMPVRKSLFTGPEITELFRTRPNFKTAVDQLPKTKGQDAARVFVPGGDEIIGKGIARITTNQEPADVVFKEVAAELTREAQPVLRQLRG
jgi:sn-glycerol 3-phosphate transport system substrate-binding protein